MITIQIKTTPETEKMLKKFPGDTRDALVKGVTRATYFAESQAKKSFGQSGHLKARSGHLRRSIKTTVKEAYGKVIGELSSNVIYARIHEEGGVIKAKNVPYLRFKVGGSWVRVKEVTMPARPFLEPAITENLAKIHKIITDTIAKELS